MGLTLVALAAGVGSRYGGLKQLEPVGARGEALLEYSVFDALRAGFSRLVLVVRPEHEVAFRRNFDSLARHISVTYVHQVLTDLPVGFELPANRVKPWGTGQAILAAEAEIDGAFAVVNADDFYGAESYLSLARFLRDLQNVSLPTFAMVAFKVGPTLSDAGSVSRALCQLDAEGHLQSIVEIAKLWKRDGEGVYFDTEGTELVLDGEELVSMNMWGFTPDLFSGLRSRFTEFLVGFGERDDSEFFLPEVVQSLVSEGRIRVEVLRQAGKWCGITYQEDRDRTAEFISNLVSQGEYPAPLWGPRGQSR